MALVTGPLLLWEQAPRPPKLPRVEPYQFYPQELLALLEQEVHSYQRLQGYKASAGLDWCWLG